MTIEQARAIYEELRERYEASLAAAGLRCESEIYLEDEEFERTEDESKAALIELDVLVFTDNISKDDGYGFCSMADIKSGYVSESELKKDALELEEALDAFIDEVLSTGDADSIIRRENEKAEKEAEEMMREFEEKMKRSNVAAIIAVSVCAVIAAVALIMHFLL